MKTSLTVLALLALSVSCSKIEDAEKNMVTMKKKTEEMSATTDDMKDTTTVMYQQIRSKEAEDTRNKKMEILNSKEESFGSKLAAASVYFKSFEFQLWTGQKSYDDSHARDILLLDAANEFTKRVSDIYEEVNLKKMSPTKTGKSQRVEQSFYALAATMHMTHHYQDTLVSQDKGVNSVSFYDVVKSALEKDENGENLKEHEAVLVSGNNKEMMLELIKARVDMLSALALKNLTDKRDMTLGQKVKGLLFKTTAGKLGSIDLPETYDSANLSTKEQTIKYLNGALKAKDFLARLGIGKRLERTLRSAYSKIDLNDQGSEKESSIDKNKSEIKSLIENLLQ